jgi:hypothetical protein
MFGFCNRILKSLCICFLFFAHLHFVTTISLNLCTYIFSSHFHFATTISLWNTTSIVHQGKFSCWSFHEFTMFFNPYGATLLNMWTLIFIFGVCASFFGCNFVKVVSFNFSFLVYVLCFLSNVISFLIYETMSFLVFFLVSFCETLKSWVFLAWRCFIMCL